ncbi:tyrosine-type recombinase/integrase [Rhodococcus sp. JS3073]|uniref:tyrosine-type recombinase/integrase n=1 Tax=Rhodococcus sp. JS3073 TaxID=3002901 RepID=UPI0022868B9E|nr:tyrosine-type recombinase/integrase [Rhodococcus sp. JS3073]WAM20046.1 tyrosine-type recombinase/integrase [Rhodococcus sp. JS3073]
MGLDRDDVHLDDSLLIVRRSKFDKSRQVPLHQTTTDALEDYARRRDDLCPHPAVPCFFLSGAGTRLNHTNVSKTFAGLLAAAGVVAPLGRRRPRPYDLRHSFAVATLVAWYADDVAVPARLPALSTYLGRIQPVVATLCRGGECSCSAKTSAGEFQRWIFRGRLLSASATA